MNNLDTTPLEDILPIIKEPARVPTVQEVAGFDQPTQEQTDKADASIFQQSKLLDDVEVSEKKVLKKTVGKRGKDTQPRKKCVMTPAKTAALNKARIASAKKAKEKREAKAAAKKAKEEPIEIAVEVPATPPPSPEPIAVKQEPVSLVQDDNNKVPNKISPTLPKTEKKPTPVKPEPEQRYSLREWKALQEHFGRKLHSQAPPLKPPKLVRQDATISKVPPRASRMRSNYAEEFRATQNKKPVRAISMNRMERAMQQPRKRQAPAPDKPANPWDAIFFKN